MIGVHTPEFTFEHDLDNVRRAVDEMRVDYPVAIDNDYAIWHAFGNHYWPALYFVDAQGGSAQHHFGEGDYEQSETIMQQLLAEAGAGGRPTTWCRSRPAGSKRPPTGATCGRPENYLGYERTENFASPGGAVRTRAAVYAAPARLGVNEWALAGDWTVGRQAVVLNAGRGADRLPLPRPRPPPRHGAGRGRARRCGSGCCSTGSRPGAAHGGDVDDQGNGTVTEPAAVSAHPPARADRDRTFEIEFLDAASRRTRSRSARQ